MSQAQRRAFFDSIKSVVVKVGSGVLTAPDGLNPSIIKSLAADIFGLTNSGRQVILVSSGAVAAGMRRMGLKKRPATIREKQAVAAIGQSRLMRLYEKAFEEHGLMVAQILLTRFDLCDRIHYLNARNTLKTLLGWGILPIINENDTVAVDELKFGDNDNLAAMVAHLLDADIMVNLTDIDGLYTGDPRTDTNACRLDFVERVTEKIESMACASPGAVGTGGMASKVAAAKKVSEAGIGAVVTNGKQPGVLAALFDGQYTGTFFAPSTKRLPSKKCWIAYALKPQGALIVDDGAARAIEKQGKSLLPIGIVQVEGIFPVGAAVECRRQDGSVIGVGLTNYDSASVEKILGLSSAQVRQTLGEKHHDEVIHRDNLVVNCQD